MTYDFAKTSVKLTRSQDIQWNVCDISFISFLPHQSLEVSPLWIINQIWAGWIQTIKCDRANIKLYIWTTKIAHYSFPLIEVCLVGFFAKKEYFTNLNYISKLDLYSL